MVKKYLEEKRKRARREENLKTAGGGLIW